MAGGSSDIGGRFGSSRLMAWTPPSDRELRPLRTTPLPSHSPMPSRTSSSCRSFAASLLALVIVGELQFLF